MKDSEESSLEQKFGDKMTKQDIVSVMHVSESTISNWIRKGILNPTSRVGQKVWFKTSDIAQMLKGAV